MIISEESGNGIRIGYARVSTNDQNPALQLDALARAGCEKIYEEYASGKRDDRAELAHALKALRPGDSLVVWRLDRLGRSLPHLVSIVSELKARGVQFESLMEKLDTASAVGELTFHIFASLASSNANSLASVQKQVWRLPAHGAGKVAVHGCSRRRKSAKQSCFLLPPRRPSPM